MGTRLGILAAVLSCAMVLGCSSKEPQVAFDSEKWKNTPELERGIFEDALLDGRLIGLSREEIRGLLGGPPASDRSEMWTYGIRYTDVGFNSVEFIYIRFDASGKATQVGIGYD